MNERCPRCGVHYDICKCEAQDMTIREVRAELADAGIDMEPAKKKLRKALREFRAVHAKHDDDD